MPAGVSLQALLFARLRAGATSLTILAKSKKFECMADYLKTVGVLNVALQERQIIFHFNAGNGLAAGANNMVMMSAVADQFVSFEALQQVNLTDNSLLHQKG